MLRCNAKITFGDNWQKDKRITYKSRFLHRKNAHPVQGCR